MLWVQILDPFLTWFLTEPLNLSIVPSSSSTQFTLNSVYLYRAECGKFYTILYEQWWYTGPITKIINSKCVVKFLRKKRNNEKEFLCPKVGDICTVCEEFIFYGPLEVDLEVNKGSEVELQLNDLPFQQINDAYRRMKEHRIHVFVLLLVFF